MSKKEILLCILFIFLGAGITTGVGYTLSQPSQSKKIETPLPQTLFSMKNAPTDTIDGHISSMSGQVELQSRIATMPAALTSIKPLQQGENIITKDKGHVTLAFPRIGTMKMSSDTQLDIIQTLPTSAVVEQPQGKITYSKIGNTPLAIRSLDVLIQLTSGDITIVSDSIKESVTIDVISGTSTVAYINDKNNSSVQNLRAGDTYIFDNTTDRGHLK